MSTQSGTPYLTKVQGRLESLDEQTAQAVREQKPEKHWAAMEMAVVYNANGRRLLHFEKTPIWGAAYYRGLRKQIAELLAP